MEGKGNALLSDATSTVKSEEQLAIAKTQRPLSTKIILINAENNVRYIQEVLAWLQFDLNQSKDKNKSFYHNKNTIEEAFAQRTAMVAVQNNEVVGFMTWSMQNDSCTAEIIIVEIKASCRRQGIFAAMISTLANSFPELHVLTARALPQADAVFTTMGWNQVQGTKHNKGDLNFYYQVIRPVAPELSELPDGTAVAVFSKADVPTTTEWVDAYSVIREPNRYQKKYFKLELDSNGQSRLPIVKPFHHEGYIGLYHNKTLIAEGKPKHLFANEHYSDLLVIKKLKLKDPQLLAKLQLFSEAKSSSSSPQTTVLPVQAPHSVDEVKSDSLQHGKETKHTPSGVSASLGRLLASTTPKRSSDTTDLPVPEAKKSTATQVQKGALPSLGGGKGI